MVDVELDLDSRSLFLCHNNCGSDSAGEDNPVSQHAGECHGTVNGDKTPVIILRMRFSFDFIG